MLQELTQYLVDHPFILASLAAFLVLAAIGGWYVVYHHLHAILITMLCAAGFISGIIVFYRGYQADMKDLMIVGSFLIVIFPLVYHQAIHIAKIAFTGETGAVAMSKGHAKRAGA